ncbi:MAG: YbhB/YbcL family Raf kinase inhibitor-like protein [Thermoplasmata archaeon]
MRIRSNDFEEGGDIPSVFTCDGEDISPHLAWEEVPEGTKSFALIVDDPDAPMGTWVHWLLGDIPAGTREIPQSSRPPGSRQVTNDFGREDYGGPCPPSGTHRYYFKLYALDIERMQATEKRAFYREVEEHKVGEAVIMGRYSRT